MTMEKWIVAALALAFYIWAAVQVLRISREMHKANGEYKAALDDFGSASGALFAVWLREAQLSDARAAAAEKDAHDFWRQIDHGDAEGEAANRGE